MDEFYLTSFILRDLDEFEDYKDLNILYEVCNVSYYIIYVYSKVRKWFCIPHFAFHFENIIFAEELIFD